MNKVRLLVVTMLTAVMAFTAVAPANAASHNRVLVHKSSAISIGIQLGVDGGFAVQQVKPNYNTRYSAVKYSIDGMGSAKKNCYVLQHLRGKTWFEENGQPDGKGYRALPGPSTSYLTIRAVQKPASYCR